jgi:transcriptional regulator with XRE-family HTH domain
MKLREYRESKGISQFTLAVAAGVTTGTVANIERGEGCTARTAQKIIQTTGGAVTLDDLVTLEVDEGADETQEQSGRVA